MTKIEMRPGDIGVRDLLLNGLTFSSGAVDAISFLTLGKVFAAFMTGNIAFLGLRLAGAGGPGWVAIMVAIAGFSVGVYLGTWIVKPRGRGGLGVWPRRVTVTLGLSLLGHAGFLILWLAVGGQPSTDVAHVLLGFWGVAMGMQSAAVRSLHVEGVFTTAATATFIFGGREAPALGCAHLFVPRCARGRFALGPRAALCPSPTFCRHGSCRSNRGHRFSEPRRDEKCRRAKQRSRETIEMGGRYRYGRQFQA
jgi:Protein of unknown function (DUF1275)